MRKLHMTELIHSTSSATTDHSVNDINNSSSADSITSAGAPMLA